MISQRKQHAILVDAGYLFAQAIEDLFGPSVRRDGVRLDEAKAIEALREKAASVYGPDSDFLRAYWYDASPRDSSITDRHERLALHPNVKVRLGTLNSAGVQKGVDALICKDLLELSSNGAVSDILLVSGDEDLRCFVEMAQARGVRVHILSVGPQQGSVSRLLEMESDGVHRLPVRDAAAFIHLHSASSAPASKKRAPAKSKAKSSPPKQPASAPAPKKARPSRKKPAPNPQGSAPAPAASPSSPSAAAPAPSASPAPQPHAPRRDGGKRRNHKNRKNSSGGNNGNNRTAPQPQAHRPAQKPAEASARPANSRRRPRPSAPTPEA